MPSWNGVINDAQASAIAAYILAGFPHTGVAYDPDPAKASDIYTAFACIDCHGQVGGKGAPNPKTADEVVPEPAQPGRQRAAERVSRRRSWMAPSRRPGTKGVIFMPAWGQIMSTDQLNTILPYIVDGPKAKTLPAPPAASPLPLAGGASARPRRAPSSSSSP